MTGPSATVHVPALVKALYEIVADLEGHFPGRPFTPDGHLVGSLGEVLAASAYRLELYPCSSECHDAKAGDGRQVQIKATQGKSIGIRSSCEHLLVLKLLKDGSVSEVYNGPGDLAWGAAGPMQKNGQRALGVARLQSLMHQVPQEQRLTRFDA